MAADDAANSRLLLTAQTAGAVDGTWNVTVNNNGQLVDAGDIVYNQNTVTNGADGINSTVSIQANNFDIPFSATADEAGAFIALTENFEYDAATDTLSYTTPTSTRPPAVVTNDASNLNPLTLTEV